MRAMTAVQKGISATVKVFLEDGRCDVNAVTNDGENAVLLAVSEGFTNIVELLFGLSNLHETIVPEEDGSLCCILSWQKSTEGIW